MAEHLLTSNLASLELQIPTQYEFSVVIPTRNEAGNIAPLLSRIEQATKGITTEVIFVDDSTDNTPETITKLQGQFSIQVKLVSRPPERRKNGLGGAVMEGFQVAQAPWVCVMDADLQHPPELLPKIFRHAEKTGSDVVVGSRLSAEGNASSLGLKRTIISRVFAGTTRVTFPQRLKNVTDPLSGFFIIRRAALNTNILKPDGFKILLEILATHPDLVVSEIPMHFGYRLAGESKASIKETVRYFRTLFRLRLAGDQSFLRFLAVGFSGLLVNSLALAVFTEMGAIHYLFSAILATQVSTLWNFSLTEMWVFGKRGAERPFVQRLFGFLVVNNLLLLLRSPIMTFMVSLLGIHYLIANLLSLFAMTVLRYFVADQLIWNKKSGNSRPRQNQNLDSIKTEIGATK